VSKKLIGIIAVFLPVLALVLSPFFVKVTKVECSSQYGPCSENIETNAGKIVGKSLFSAKANVKKELKDNFEVERFTTQFNIPSTLKVFVVIKKPSFALKNEAVSEIDLVDSEGNVVATTSESSLPSVVTTNVLAKPGEKVGENELTALKLIAGVYQMYQVSSGKIEGDSLRIVLPSGLRVIFPIQAGADTDLLLGSLRLIESKIESDSPGFYGEVDMRYKNPVLR
jgi:hypothetical protein